jgi:hypothetical protein
LELVEEASPAPASDEVSVRVGASLLDPLSLTADLAGGSPEASFSGEICDLGTAAANGFALGDTVYGVGPAADLLTLPGDELERLPADAQLSPGQAAAIPYLCSFLRVLGAIEARPQERILITGQSVIRQLSEQFVKSLLPDAPVTQIDLTPNRALPAGLDGPFDRLIHGVTDPDDLQLSLSTLREDGEAFLLVPPGPHVLALDFYPNIHRSCLRSFVRRVGDPCRPATCPDPGHPRLFQLLEQEGIDLEAVVSHVSNASDVVGLALDGGGSAEKLIALAWS